MEELGGARQPRHPLGRGPLRHRHRSPSAWRWCASCCRSSRRTTSTRRRYVATDDPPDRAEPELATIVPDSPSKPYDMTRVIELIVDDGDFFEVAPLYAQNIVVGFARLNGHIGRRRRQPAPGAGGRARHRRLDQGRALRALLRRLQHPAGDVRGRARLPARDHPGVRRDHPPRRQAALRLQRGDRPEAHRDHPQGLRRRLRRHGLQARRGRLQRGLADGRGGRDGPRGRGQHRLPPRAGGGRGNGDDPAVRRARADRGLQGALRQPVHRRRARLHRRRDRAGGDPRVADPRARGVADQARVRGRRASTGTSRCEPGATGGRRAPAGHRAGGRGGGGGRADGRGGRAPSRPTPCRPPTGRPGGAPRHPRTPMPHARDTVRSG